MNNLGIMQGRLSPIENNKIQCFPERTWKSEFSKIHKLKIRNLEWTLDYKNFYKNPSQSALATQLFFLFQRMQQIQDLKQRSLFETVRVADFLIEKDRLFAEVNLSIEEMALYDKVYEHITIDAPTPDLVIYLQAPIDVLKNRITKRGNINEQYLTLDYLERLNDAYSKFFLDYQSAPLLIINAADINLESNDNDYEHLITKIMSNPKGKNFINPQPSII